MKKERAYLKKEFVGRWGFEPVFHWIARDAWDNYITQAKTRRECEAMCRDHGYVPER